VQFAVYADSLENIKVFISQSWDFTILNLELIYTIQYGFDPQKAVVPTSENSSVSIIWMILDFFEYKDFAEFIVHLLVSFLDQLKNLHDFFFILAA
jgi:hypothetical protein